MSPLQNTNMPLLWITLESLCTSATKITQNPYVLPPQVRTKIADVHWNSECGGPHSQDLYSNMVRVHSQSLREIDMRRISMASMRPHSVPPAPPYPASRGTQSTLVPSKENIVTHVLHFSPGKFPRGRAQAFYWGCI